MKKLIQKFNVIYILALFLSSLSMQAMDYDQKNADNFIKGMLVLPHEILSQLFFFQSNNQKEPIEKSIKFFMSLSTVCKDFNKLLTFEIIGNFCKNYAQKDKNQVLRDLTQSMRENEKNLVFSRDEKLAERYKVVRLPVLILACAGADFKVYEQETTRFLLTGALEINDIQFVDVLFKHGANPDIKNIPLTKRIWNGKPPVFFFAKTAEMIQLFIDNKVNVHAINTYGSNVLWSILTDKYSSDLMRLYLQQHVDAKNLNCSKYSLLHGFSLYCYCGGGITNSDNLIEKAKLLLKAAPDMLNHLNDNNRTPLNETIRVTTDLLLEWQKKPYHKLATLLRNHGACTAEELKKKNR